MSNVSIAKRFEQLPVPVKLMTAGSAACFADFMSFPIDTVKVRLQLQGESKLPPIPIATRIVVHTGESFIVERFYPAPQHYRGIVGTIATISREEGFRSLYNGLNAGLQRQMCFASVRLGMYEPVKLRYQQLLKVKESRGGMRDITARIFAGLTTGGMAVMVAQPTDVVKVRFQAQAKASANSSGIRYTGTWQAYKTIFATEGIAGLWRGFMPNIGRNAIVNVSEIVCYDLVKELIIIKGIMNDNIPCHFTAAVVAGFCATLCASPIDVVKTRYMNAAPGTYRGAVDCALQTFVKEGPPAFYKGFMPSFSRLVSWNIVMWLSYEQLKRVVVTKYEEHEHFETTPY